MTLGQRLRPSTADALLVATGRIPNGDLLDAEAGRRRRRRDGQVVVDEYQRTTARGIFALGDVCSAYQLKHVANHEARVVRHNLLRDWDDTASMTQSDHRFVPSAVFTDPQIAMVGLTEDEAREQGFDVVVKVQEYGDTAYGWAMEDTTGVAKLIAERGTGKLLGAHLMGYQASIADPADHPGDELRSGRPGDGSRPVLDPSRPAGSHRERTAGVVR